MMEVVVEMMTTVMIAMVGTGDGCDDNGCRDDGGSGCLVVVSVCIELLLALLLVVGCWK